MNKRLRVISGQPFQFIEFIAGNFLTYSSCKSSSFAPTQNPEPNNVFEPPFTLRVCRIFYAFMHIYIQNTRSTLTRLRSNSSITLNSLHAYIPALAPLDAEQDVDAAGPNYANLRRSSRNPGAVTGLAVYRSHSLRFPAGYVRALLPAAPPAWTAAGTLMWRLLIPSLQMRLAAPQSSTRAVFKCVAACAICFGSKKLNGGLMAQLCAYLAGSIEEEGRGM